METPSNSCSSDQLNNDCPAVATRHPVQEQYAENQPVPLAGDADSAAYGQEVHVLIYGKRRGVYRVPFTIRGDTVHILTVRHSAQRRFADEINEDEVDEKPVN